MYSQITANKRKTWLLIFLFSVLIIFLGWVFSTTLELGPIVLLFAAIFTILMSLTSYYRGDKIALATNGAKPLAQRDSPEIYRLVENLAITAGLPTPKIYLISDPAANAFATGRDPEHATIAITTGLINLLNKEELEAVIAHELSHIKNYDIRLMTVIAILVGLAALLAELFMRMQWYGLGDRRSSRELNKLRIILMTVGIFLMILSPIIAQLIQLAVSRKREFLADASSALLTRYPQGLINALNKIDQQPNILTRANHATAHMFFSSPFKNSRQFLNKLFLTHPPTDERITALQAMAKAEPT